MRYVLVTGGVVSGLGKGVTASSIGVLLQRCGHRVTAVKIGENKRASEERVEKRSTARCERAAPVSPAHARPHAPLTLSQTPT